MFLARHVFCVMSRSFCDSMKKRERKAASVLNSSLDATRTARLGFLANVELVRSDHHVRTHLDPLVSILLSIDGGDLEIMRLNQSKRRM
jgi:hypothetical protein